MVTALAICIMLLLAWESSEGIIMDSPRTKNFIIRIEFVHQRWRRRRSKRISRDTVIDSMWEFLSQLTLNSTSTWDAGKWWGRWKSKWERGFDFFQLTEQYSSWTIVWQNKFAICAVSFQAVEEKSSIRMRGRRGTVVEHVNSFCQRKESRHCSFLNMKIYTITPN